MSTVVPPLEIESSSELCSDFCIVGGGMVGAALAIALARQGRQVVLREKQAPAFKSGTLGMGIRTVALSPASEAWLAGLDIRISGALIHRMHVFEALGTAVLDFDADEAGTAHLGAIVENDRLVDELWRQLSQYPNLTVQLDASLERIEHTAEAVLLHGTGDVVRTRLCIAADGAASTVRRLTGTEPQRFDTGQWALATVVRTEKPHEGCAYQRFLEDGPVALLPGIEPDLVAVVWSQPPDQAHRRQALAHGAFCDELSRATASVLGAVKAVDQRLTFPLVQQISAPLLPAPRVVLTGDAARVVHPLAGMGVNLGFEDAALLADLCRASADPGEDQGLQSYARKRLWRSRALVTLMSTLQGIYGWRQPGPVWLRNAGVRFVNRQSLVRHQLLREALGLGPVAVASH
ncbi:MAG: FAD-dependent oxidoreductase [Gammaproteobacteria bacterium]|nr:FAD-dependent oxidoreductase [Gammaproteobacteria bacterium]